MRAAKRPPVKRQKASPGGGRYQTRTDDLFRVKDARPVSQRVPRGDFVASVAAVDRRLHGGGAPGVRAR